MSRTAWIVWTFSALLTAAPTADAASWTLPDTIAGTVKCPAVDKQQVYTAKTLFEYINGGADVYIAAGMVRCLARRYRIDKQGEIEVNAYDLERPLHAFGLYRELTAGDSAVTGIGAECAWRERRIAFWKDRYYVETFDKCNPARSAAEMTAVAAALAKIAPGSTALPQELRALPDSARVPGSERYTRNDYLAHGFMKDALSAGYTTPEGICELFVMVKLSDGDAAQVFASMKQGFGTPLKLRQGSPLPPATSMVVGNLTAVLTGARIVGVSCACAEACREGLLVRALKAAVQGK